MSQRASGYERRERDLYETPAWVTEVLMPHVPERCGRIWEPASGAGKMADILHVWQDSVFRSDIHQIEGARLDLVGDFLQINCMQGLDTQAIITNPPYNLAQQFIEHALGLTRDCCGFVAMLLRCDFDHAKSRAHLFAEHDAWCKKLVLRRRIQWFDGGSSPSFNHAWYIWDWKHEGPATLAYAG